MYPRVPPFARIAQEPAQATGRRAFAYALDHGTAELTDLDIAQAIGASVLFVIQADVHPPVRERYSATRAHLMQEHARREETRAQAARLEELRAALAGLSFRQEPDQDADGGQEVRPPAPRPQPPTGPGLAIQPPHVQRPRAALPFTL